MKRSEFENPFILTGYEGPEYFCDREEETAELHEAVHNGRNVTMLAPRRIGKTGLIKHLFRELEQEGEYKPIYVDIYGVGNLREFTERFAAAIIGSMDSSIERAISKASQFFKSFRPGVSIDPMTGSATYSFGLQVTKPEISLKECFDYLAAEGRKSVIAIDEFQQVAEFPEKGTEGLLRSYIQFLSHTRFIFAGSRQHLMSEMFMSVKRPFYNSTSVLQLGLIDREKYFNFASGHFRRAGMELDPEVFGRVYDMFDGITWYVQAVLNRLYARRSATAEDVSVAVDKLMNERSWDFGNLLDSYPDGSVRLMKAIAREGKVEELTSAEFIARHHLTAASSVNLAMKKLLANDIIYKGEGGYEINDRLFALWLRR